MISFASGAINYRCEQPAK